MYQEFLDKVESYSADDLLKVPVYEPEHVFPKNIDGIKVVYKELAKKWHPDKNSSAPKDLFNHIVKLKQEADRKIQNGTWQVPGIKTIKTVDGKEFQISYLKHRPFELGDSYITSNKVIYIIKKDYKDLYKNAVEKINNIEYADDKMRQGFSTYMPKLLAHYDLSDGSHALVIERDPDTVLLRDYLEAQGPIDPKHVAWIMSRMHNMTSYLQYAGLTHNALTVDNCFILPKDTKFKRSAANPIAPKDHCVFVAGGWWYAVSNNEKLLGLPSQALPHAPKNVLEYGVADPELDRKMIRVMGCELLGDITGFDLRHNPKIPNAMANWLTLPAGDDAMEDFKIWRDEILPKCFGKRVFIEMSVDINKIYPKQKP